MSATRPAHTVLVTGADKGIGAGGKVAVITSRVGALGENQSGGLAITSDFFDLLD